MLPPGNLDSSIREGPDARGCGSSFHCSPKARACALRPEQPAISARLTGDEGSAAPGECRPRGRLLQPSVPATSPGIGRSRRPSHGRQPDRVSVVGDDAPCHLRAAEPAATRIPDEQAPPNIADPDTALAGFNSD